MGTHRAGPGYGGGRGEGGGDSFQNPFFPLKGFPPMLSLGNSVFIG